MNLPPLHQLSLRVAPTGNIDEPPVADDFVELKAVLERERDKPAGERAVKDVDNDVYKRLIASVPVWRAYNELERVSREVPDVEGDEAQIEAQTAAIAVAQAQLDAAIQALAGGGATPRTSLITSSTCSPGTATCLKRSRRPCACSKP